MKQIQAKAGLDNFRIPVPEYFTQEAVMLIGIKSKDSSDLKKRAMGLTATTKVFLTKYNSSAHYLQLDNHQLPLI
jgi:hypothetical protein